MIRIQYTGRGAIGTARPTVQHCHPILTWYKRRRDSGNGLIQNWGSLQRRFNMLRAKRVQFEVEMTEVAESE